MKTRPWLALVLVVLMLCFILLLNWAEDAARAMFEEPAAQEEAELFPIVMWQPTFTPTPTPSPTPTPTSLPPGAYIQDNHSSFAHSGAGYSVVGEIWNNSDDHLWNIQVGARFYDAQDQLVHTISRNLAFNLAPGKRICFSLDNWVDEVDWEYYEFDPLSYFDGAALPVPVVAFNVSGGPIADRFYISGRIRNEHTATIDYARVQGTLFDEDGLVVDCRWEYAYEEILPPAGETPFEVDFTFRASGYSDVDNFRVVVQADEYHR